MAYLHSDREQFRDAIDLAYEQTGVMVQAIEKDYYVTMLLRLLAQRMVSAFIENVFVHDGGRIVVRFKYEQSIQDTVKALQTG